MSNKLFSLMAAISTLIILIFLFPPVISLDIKITDEKLSKISFWRASGNYFVSYFSGLLLFIGFIMIAFTSRKQGLHNFISRIVCIRDK